MQIGSISLSYGLILYMQFFSKVCFPKRKFVRYRADEILTLFVKDFTTVLRAKSKNQPHHTAMPA